MDRGRRFRYSRYQTAMNPEEIARAKTRTRRMVDEALARLTPGRRRAASVAVKERVVNLPSVRDARTILVFLSLPTEIDTWPIIGWAWREAKRVAVPRIEPRRPSRASGPALPSALRLPSGLSLRVEDRLEESEAEGSSGGGGGGPPARRDMVAVVLPPADVEGVAAHPSVRPGTLGILEVPDAPPLDVSEIDVALVPCQAVDRSGNRLGKGGGFFDRFLARPDFRATAIALAFLEQVLDQVPVTRDDQPVSMVVTDAEVLSFAPRPKPGRKAGRGAVNA